MRGLERNAIRELAENIGYPDSNFGGTGTVGTESGLGESLHPQNHTRRSAQPVGGQKSEGWRSMLCHYKGMERLLNDVED